MYEQQVAYLKKVKKWKNRQYHSIIKTGDKIYIIGGKNIITLSLQQQLHKNNNNNNTMHTSLLPIEGHTSHSINQNDLLISLFGKNETNQFDMIVFYNHNASFATFTFQPTTSPSKRYGHTSIYNKNTNSVFLIGGNNLNHKTTLSDIWKLDWPTKQWIKLLNNINPIVGHTTILLPNNNTLLTCFGANQHSHHLPQQFYNYCTLFNTHSLRYQSIKQPIPLLPRIYSTMISVNTTHAFIYGGLSEKNELLNDMWWIDFHNHKQLAFTFIGEAIPRAKHAAFFIPRDNILLIDGGQYIGSAMEETVVYNVNHLSNPSPINQHHHHHQIKPRSEPPSSSTNSGLTGGAIGGMIIGIVLGIGLAIALFVLIQRKQRQQRTFDIHSRAARFSLSTPPRQSTSIMERRSTVIQSPEIAKTRLSRMSFGSDFRLSLNNDQHQQSQNKRVQSTIIPSTSSASSLALPNHNSTFESPSRQLYTNWVCETPLPPTTITRNSTFLNNNNNNNNINPNHTSHILSNSSSSNDHHHHQQVPYHLSMQNTSTPSIILEDQKQQSSQNENTGIKKFRLSLFKTLDEPSYNSQQQQQPSSSTEHSSSQLGDTRATKRRSSLFGLSKLLNSHQEPKKEEQEGIEKKLNQQEINRSSIQKEIRASLGSKSVSSIQWVGFNNDMDFSTNGSSPRLTVMNHRQSCTTISSSSGVLSGIISSNSSSLDDIDHNNNQSPRNTSTYRLSQRELKSWEENRLSWIMTPPPPHRN
ncbi:hypothetical protein BJ944DRAFT_259599 [Cunninghamella echinulata]|nr:hypothetical protein BJ944DRAFT_259599 [Cunninghamella echinulata]